MSLTRRHNRCAVKAPRLPKAGSFKGSDAYRIANSAARWLLPGALFIIIPKCPLCIVAYVAAFTGIGLSVAAAESIRLLLMTTCIAAFVYLSALVIRRLSVNVRSHKI
ncbi:MAG: hypothetical protein ABJB34_08415 [Acidobacteriota bacterium]